MAHPDAASIVAFRKDCQVCLSLHTFLEHSCSQFSGLVSGIVARGDVGGHPDGGRGQRGRMARGGAGLGVPRPAANDAVPTGIGGYLVSVAPLHDFVSACVCGGRGGGCPQSRSRADLFAAVFALCDRALADAARNFLDKTLPFTLLEDLFDNLTRAEFPPPFSYLERNINTFMLLDVKVSRVSMLTLCNGLLRRLSKSQDSALTGRVLLMLASALTLEEKSGFNIVGKYAVQTEVSNLQRVGAASVSVPAAPAALPVLAAPEPTAAAAAAAMDVEGAEPASAASAAGDASVGAADDAADAVDFADMLDVALPDAPSASDRVEASTAVGRAKSFFTTLWSLQTWFSDPNLLKVPAQASAFVSAATAVLQAFEQVPCTAAAAAPADATPSSVPNAARFLPSRRLLHLQLRDAEFRLHLTVQCVMVLTYCLVDCRKRNYVFKAPVLGQLQGLLARCHVLLASTPSAGASFSEVRACLHCFISHSCCVCCSRRPPPATWR